MTSPAAADDRLRDALREASRMVANDRTGVLHVDAASADEISLNCEAIEAAVLAGLAGEPLPQLPKTHLARRMLERLRSGFLDHISGLAPLPDTAAVLRWLGAVEGVAHAMEADWKQRFSDRLSGPDGLELVVEVAHDLRSPLTSILFLAETIRRGRSGPLTALQERQLGLIYAAAFGLTSVASDVIELTRAGERQLDLNPLPFSVGDILESVGDIVRPIAEEKGLEVRLTGSETLLRVGYPVALSRVLLNLTTNALKFTDEGHVEVKSEMRSPTELEFSVRDTGRGIPASSMAMLFEPFRRRHRDREYAFSGSGLGLSICRKLVEAMKGELKVETSPEAGTRFFFTLNLPPLNADGAEPQ